jgi:hypothetical protein
MRLAPNDIPRRARPPGTIATRSATDRADLVKDRIHGGLAINAPRPV